MATYTVQLRRICELYSRDTVENWFKDYELSDYLTQEQIETIETANIWSKEKLAKKIVDHYYMREIGLETPALFKHYVKITMQEIMEDYLKVIYSNSIKFDPLVNVDFTETFEREIEGNAENEGTSTSSSNSLSIANDTPQKRITKQDLDTGAYASQVNQGDINDETKTNSSGNSNQKENYTRHQKGNSGISTTAQALIMQYRDSIRAVDREIIESLNSLFMGIY